MDAWIDDTDQFLKTGSRCCMWWLTGLRGYEISRINLVPHSSPLGHIWYTRIWWLEQGTKGDENGEAKR